MSTPLERWHSVNLALACFALDPASLGGIDLRARAGPVRDRFEAGLKEALNGSALSRITPNIDDQGLFGGLDLAATLEAGALRTTTGLLDRSEVLLLAMAERVEPALAGRLAHALDTQGLALVTLDEGAEPGEQTPAAIKDRLAIHLDLSDHPLSDAPELQFDQEALDNARFALPRINVSDEDRRAVVTLAAQLGVASMRAPLQALAVARASAALCGGAEVEQQDLLLAVELVLAPRATRLPEQEVEPEVSDAPPPPEPEVEEDRTDPPQPSLDDVPAEILLEAAKAMLPPDLLARLAAGKARAASSGTGAGSKRTGNRRGRPLAPRPGRLNGGARLDLVATLRAAAPWQTIRKRLSGDENRIHVRPSDLRLRRYQETSDRAIIFVVDASGSAAMARLAEAKGAVELLLGEAYARRDHVALVAFRGTGSDILLPPTRSLVQTKRRLSTLPGGGGTPLAAGLKAALDLAGLARGKGMTPSIALLTDGRANVDLSGAANRTRAAEDASLMARIVRGEGISGLVIDTGQRPTRGLDGLAREMGAPYLPLPRADGRSLSQAVDAALAP